MRWNSNKNKQAHGRPYSVANLLGCPMKNTLNTSNQFPEITGKSIGLFGGSFNPAHNGHLDVSMFALDALNLDEIWWLVSPQNPLKDSSNTAPIEQRIQSCIDVVGNRDNIRILQLENLLKTQYTIDTVGGILGHYPTHTFVWIMGTDNLLSMQKWKDWQDLWQTIPMGIVNRQTYDDDGMQTPVIRQYAHKQVEPNQLKNTPAPAWAFLEMPYNPTSSTDIRKHGAK